MKLGKIGHVGIVVRDIDAAKEHFTKLLGIKKWWEVVYDGDINMYYHDQKVNCQVPLYFGGNGHTQIELLQTRGDKNIYETFLERHGEGIHHLQYNVKCLKDAIADAEKEGLHVIQHADFYSGGAHVEYAYVGKSEDDVVFELIETTIAGGMKKGDMPFEAQLATLTGSYRRLK